MSIEYERFSNHSIQAGAQACSYPSTTGSLTDCNGWQVCGKAGHNAGFVGSVYFDCPNKPCYLCKKSGHTTMTCPYRTAPELGCIQAASVSSHGILASVLQREHDAR